MENLENYTASIFDSIKHFDEDGNEYWSARELQKVLDYTEWRKFNGVIDKAKIACVKSGNNDNDWFVGADKPITTGKGKKEIIKDYHLSRYACYLIAQNGDSRKKTIALAQTYFAHQTRKQELLEEEYSKLSEDEKRIRNRKRVKSLNFGLNRTAIASGVKNMAEFHNAGYKGLYNGETANDIFKRKKLKYREDILDYMGSEELGANIFRITQTEAKLKRDKVDNEYDANSTHYSVGKEVRNSIRKLGGTMPEDLPTPKSNVKELEDKK